MKKSILVISLFFTTFVSFAQFDFGNNISLEIEQDDSYRIYMKFDNPEVLETVKSKLFTALLQEGIIDDIDDSDTFASTQKINGKKAYSFEIDESGVDLYINKEVMPLRTYKNMKVVCKEIHDYIKKNTEENKKSTRKKDQSEKSVARYSGNISIDVNDNPETYKIKAKYDEEGQYEKLIEFLTKKLDAKYLTKIKNTYSWTYQADDQIVYRFEVKKGKFSAIIAKDLLETNFYDKLKDIAEVSKLLIKKNVPETPEPPRRP